MRIKFWSFIDKKTRQTEFQLPLLINVHVSLNVLANKLENSRPRSSNVVIQINERCFSPRTRFHGIVHRALNHRERARSRRKGRAQASRAICQRIFFKDDSPRDRAERLLQRYHERNKFAVLEIITLLPAQALPRVCKRNTSRHSLEDRLANAGLAASHNPRWD